MVQCRLYNAQLQEYLVVMLGAVPVSLNSWVQELSMSAKHWDSANSMLPPRTGKGKEVQDRSRTCPGQ